MLATQSKFYKNQKKPVLQIQYVEEKHSQLKQDPKSNLFLLRPKNEEAEKDKFRYYWQNFAQKGKPYNPRFQYADQQGAQRVLDNMRVVYSTKYKQQAKQVIDETLKIYGSCQKYKEEAWGKEINKE